jgi:hypothetical protein
VITKQGLGGCGRNIGRLSQLAKQQIHIKCNFEIAHFAQATTQSFKQRTRKIYYWVLVFLIKLN